MDELTIKRLRNLFDLGAVLKDKRDPEKLSKLVERTAKILKQHDNDFTRTYHNVLMAFLYSASDKEENSLTCYYRALENSINTGDKKLISMCYNLIGIFYLNINESERGIFYFKRALEFVPDSAFIMGNIGSAYLENKEYDKSISYLKRTITQLETSNVEKKKIFNTVHNLAIAYTHLNEPEQTYKYLKYCEELIADEPETVNKCVLLENLGCYYCDIGQTDKALDTLLEALRIAEKIEDHNMRMKLYNQLSEFYRGSDNYELAYKYHKLYHELSQAEKNSELSEKIASIEKEYSKKTREIEQEKQKLSENKLEYQKRFHAINKLISNEIGLGKVGFFSESMKKIVDTVKIYHKERVVPILIEGETGTGKEIIARMIHYGDDFSSNGPFVVINCSAISESLFESELFGYSEGAFTGAKKRGNIGKMELAQGGTLFLDEIGDLPANLQPKLLRAIQYRSINRIGGKESIDLDIRIICATNRKLSEEVENGNFRKDLYHRIVTGHINIPPLRERKEEIEPLTRLFIDEISHEKRITKLGISDEALDLLKNYHWPGNIRELKSAIERVIITSQDRTILAKHFDFLTSEGKKIPSNVPHLLIKLGTQKLIEIEKRVIESTLDHFNHNKSAAADSLGISRATFYRKLKE